MGAAILVIVTILGGTPGAPQYARYCAACHGLDAKGGDKAPALVGPRSVTPRSDAELLRVIEDGTTQGMPPFGQIGSANLALLVQYLRALAGQRQAPAAPSPATAAEVAAGRALFFGTAGCARCHIVQGHGGFLGPDLTSYGRNRTVDAIEHAIVAPDNPLAPSAQVVTVTTRSGAVYTGALRNEDAFNLDLQTPDGRYHFFPLSTLNKVVYSDHSFMPHDYQSRLTPPQLTAIASFLEDAGRGPQPSEPPQ